MSKKKLNVFLASPRGFCAGVVRAIETVKLTIQTDGAPARVLHEIVHNKHVLAELENDGAVFVEQLTDIPPGDICIFSAHGVSNDVVEKAEELGLRTIDATCPLVSSVHKVVEKYHKEDFDIIIIGHHKHPEVEATAGRVSGKVHIVATEEEAGAVEIVDPSKVVYVTQTTLSQNDISGIRAVLLTRFPEIKGQSSNICFATQNRQDAVKELAAISDIVFVVGSKNSSNSNRLCEVAKRQGRQGYLIDDAKDIDPSWLDGAGSLGITAGASAPERLVQGVLEWLNERFAIEIVEMGGKEEKVYFKPAELE